MRFIFLLFLGMIIDANGMQGGFMECVRQNARNPQQLFLALHEKQDACSREFCRCFEGEEDTSEIKRDVDAISNSAQRAEIIAAARYISEILYEKTSQADWSDINALNNLMYAKRFSAVVVGDNSSIQTEKDQDDGAFVQNMLGDMFTNRKTFLDGFNEIEFNQ